MIKENLLRLREAIPAGVTIVAVSKGRSIEEIKEAVRAGVTDIGENKVQEALLKYRELQAPNSQLPTIKWHMAGRLQTNKAKDAVKIFDLIQSVDSLHLAVEIDKQAAKINKIQDILIEIKTSPEATKSGLSPEQAIPVIKEIAKLKNISIKGLMTIAPAVGDPEKARPYFRMLRELQDKIRFAVCGLRFASLTANRYPLTILSMGMTDDFKVAIEEGATMVRLGRAIFEAVT